MTAADYVSRYRDAYAKVHGEIPDVKIDRGMIKEMTRHLTYRTVSRKDIWLRITKLEEKVAKGEIYKPPTE